MSLKRLSEHLESVEIPEPQPAEPVTQPECSVCGDAGVWTGYLAGKNGQRIEWFGKPCPANCTAGQREQTQREQDRINTLMGDADLPPKLAEARLSSVLQPPSIMAAVTQAMQERRSLFFGGAHGRGKTFLAAALMLDELVRGRACRFTVVPDLLDRIRRCYGEQGVSADDVLDAVETIDLLVLDDLGTQHCTPWALEKLYQIINSRYLHSRQTIITTNQTGSQLAAQIGLRIVSRLGEMCQTVNFGGPDRRLVRDRDRWLEITERLQGV